MSIWAKLYEVNGWQVLIAKEYDENEDNPFAIAQEIRTTDGTSLKVCLRFPQEEQCNSAFELVDQGSAERFIELLRGKGVIDLLEATEKECE